MDRRELIMARMLTVLADIAGVETAARNLDEIADIKTPAIVLYDGDENALDLERAVGDKPNTVIAEPVIVLSLKDVPEASGTMANAFVLEIKKSLLFDSELATLCGVTTRSGIRYMGISENSLTPGRATVVTLNLHFNATYAFQPSEF